MKNLINRHRITRQSLKRFWAECAWIGHYSMRYKWQVALYTFLGILGTAMSLAGSVASKYIIDAVTGYDNSILLAAAVFYVLMQLLRIGINAATSRISAKVNIQVHQQIRRDIFDRMMDTDWESVSGYHSADLLNRLTGDVSTVSASVLGWIPDLVTRLLQFAGTLGVLMYYDPTLALLALISAPLTMGLGQVAMKRMRQHNQTMRQLSSELMVFNEESLQNLQTVKAFNLKQLRKDTLRQLQQKHKDATLSYNRYSVRNTTFMSLMGTVVTLACTGWGVYRLWTGHITFGTMTLYLQLAASLSAAFNALVRMVPSAINAATAANRVMAVTELPVEDHSGVEAAQSLKARQGDEGVSISVENVSFGYGKSADVLKDVNIQAQPGQIVALVGPSGGGKTTLLRLLLGIVRPREGSLQVCGQDGQTLELNASTRCLFSYVPQSNTVFAGTVAENLRMVKPGATDEELHRVLKIACAEKFISKKPLGLDTPILEKGGGFSLGQIQRLSIARALLADAPVLLMDEATSALDIATERQVLKNIMEAGLRRTCIVATHRPSVLSMCQRAYRVEEGTATPVSREEMDELIQAVF